MLVLGGGPAGIWAAISAAAAGARVVLVDKGRCGSSGPTAYGTTSLWNIPPGRARDEAVQRGYAQGGGLGDPEWMYRVLEETHLRVEQLVRWGYRLPGAADEGAPRPRVCLDGASYLRRLRRRAHEAGVQVLDHHPALQLLVDADGVVTGAQGLQKHNRFQPWTIRAGAVVVATGGCAFLSGGVGTEVDTGDGLLLAVEAGAQLSGMEFSSAYGLAPVSELGADLALHFTTLYDESGSVIPGHQSGALAAIADGRRVYAALDDVPEAVRCRLSQQGVVDSTRRVPLRAVLEGTVRGTGGLRIAGSDCATTVAGLYGAGDVTTREPITGAVSGFGGQGGAWAIASGVWAGAGAAGFARGRGRPGPARAVPGAGLNTVARIDPRAVVGLVQEHTLPLRRSYWRSAGSLRDSIAELDAMWPGVKFDLGGIGAHRLRARQAAALLAVARWTKYSALARTESRGMHRRTDHPGATEDWRVRLMSGGLEDVWVRPEGRSAEVDEATAAAPVLPGGPQLREPVLRGGTVVVGPRERPMVARADHIPADPDVAVAEALPSGPQLRGGAARGESPAVAPDGPADLTAPVPLPL